jgi:GNAT superfamily N-acetyltransferase
VNPLWPTRKKQFHVATDEKESYSVLSPEGRTKVYFLHQPDRKAVPYAWVLVTVEKDDPKACILWDIHTNEQFRRKGYASRLIKNVLQKEFSYIFSQYQRGLINSPGTQLCVKCGFVLKPQMWKHQPPTLEWERKD